MLHPNKKYCINHSDKKIFAHQRCLYCYRKEILYPKQLAKPKKIYKIKNYSPKRVLLNDEYSRVKKEKWLQFIKEGNNKCFFTDIWLDPKGPIPDFHHLFGKDGDLLCDVNNMFPVLFKFHREYHDLQRDYENLAKEDKLWYSNFLIRIKMSHPLLYHKEIYLIQKANQKTTKWQNM